MAQNLNLANLLAIQGFNVSGVNNSQSGYSVRNAGDVNGDDYDDFLIGAPYYDSSTGIVYLIYGSNNLTNINLVSLGTQGITITGAGVGYYTGWSVSGAGDVNGDGYDDFLIGAPYYDSSTGIAYLIYGSNSLTNINLASLGTQGISIIGSVTDLYLGWSVSAAGDVNSDGYGDFLIGGPGYISDTGIAYLIFGSNSLTNINTDDLESTTYITLNNPPGQTYGTGLSVSSAGDTNGDGYDDFLIGAPGYSSDTGLVYLIYGSSSLTSNINLGSLGTQGITITGAGTDYVTGNSVSAAGDVNGDGYDDFLIGAPGYSSDTGLVYLIYGSNSLSSNINLASLGTQGITIIGAGTNYVTGTSVSTAGDVNGDGYDDFLISAPDYYLYTGIVYLIYGNESLTNLNLTFLGATQGITLIGAEPDYLTGYSVSGAGDLNKDGYNDVIIGAPIANSHAGASYVIYGAASGFVTSSPTSYPSNKPSNLPSSAPTKQPSPDPSGQPSDKPTSYPNSEPTAIPSAPTNFPSSEPSVFPSVKPNAYPTYNPTTIPSSYPSHFPSSNPTLQPIAYPTSQPTPTRQIINNNNINVDTAIYSTAASFAGGILIYLFPSFILRNWGYKYKYVYTEQEKESLRPHEIGLFKKEDRLFALHKEKDETVEYLLGANNRDINDISLKLYQLIEEQLENNPLFKRNPANSSYKYIYDETEVKALKENEIGLKFTGSLPLLSCNIFCNSEKLIAFKLVDGMLRRFSLRVASNENEGISKTLYHAMASEYINLSNSFLTTLEETQIRDFLLVPGKLKPSISVFQKVFCLYTPVYKDLGNAPGFVHNLLNCNGHGVELLYRLITLDGTIPGFIYGLCHTFLKKYQVGLNQRISDDSFAKIAIYLDSHLKSEVSSQTINNPINQEKKDDLERGHIGSNLDSSSFEQASSSVEMFERIKKPTSACIIQAVCEIKFDNPIINEAYNKRLGLEALKKLPFLSEEADVKQITQLGNSESYKSDKSSFNKPDINYSNHIIGTFINARQVIEYIPIMKYVSQNIIYPLIENHLPETVKNISLPEILDSKLFLFTAHLGLGSIGAMLLPHEIIYKGLIASTASSMAFGVRLAASDYLAEQKQLALSNDKTMNAFEITKYCVSTILAYTAPAFVACALGQVVMPGYQCTELDLGAKLSFAGVECYSVYKATQAPMKPTTADIVVPYVADGIAAVVAYTNGYGAMAVMCSVVNADWISRALMDMVHKEVKAKYIDPIFEYIQEMEFHEMNNLSQLSNLTLSYFESNS